MTIYLYKSKYGKARKTQLEILKKFFQDWNTAQPMVICFHGGLIEESKALDLAARLEFEFGNAHTLFFIWNSNPVVILKDLVQRAAGFLETDEAKAVLKSVSRGAKKKGVKEKLSSVRLRKQANGVLWRREPYKSDLKKVASELPAIPKIFEEELFKARLSSGVTRRKKSSFLKKQGFFGNLKDGVESLFMLFHVLRRKRPGSGDDRALRAVIVEEVLRALWVDKIGGLVWNGIKEQIRESFKAGGAGTAFLKALKVYCKINPSPKRIILVGHSAGTIYAAHMIAAANKILPPECKFEVVFLASACTFKTFEKLVLKNQARVKKDGIWFFGLQGKTEKSDALMKGNNVLEFLYPHSLLYFVSGVLGKDSNEPLIGMELFFKNSKHNKGSVKKVRDFVKPKYRYWSPIDKKVTAKDHANFIEDTALLASIRKIIDTGAC
ncbi:MAG: hypothetical protein K2Y39_28990 [Candidatus Obscuribacterales bacterium]|nr:hypothetical protein [Candidatus Obscuribacterales bacterium]